MKQLFVMICFLLIMVFNVSCSKDEKANDSCIELKEVHNSGCKGYEGITNRANIGDGIDEYVEYKALDGNLLVYHINSLYPCDQGTLQVKVVPKDGRIIIQEDKGANDTNCLCYYDLSYIINGFIIGKKYEVEIRKGAQKELSFSFVYSMSLYGKSVLFE